MDGITDARDKNLDKVWEMVRSREAWRSGVHGVEKNHHNKNNSRKVRTCVS